MAETITKQIEIKVNSKSLEQATKEAEKFNKEIEEAFGGNQKEIQDFQDALKAIPLTTAEGVKTLNKLNTGFEKAYKSGKLTASSIDKINNSIASTNNEIKRLGDIDNVLASIENDFLDGTDGVARFQEELAQTPQTLFDLELRLKNLKGILNDSVKVGSDGFRVVNNEILSTNERIVELRQQTQATKIKTQDLGGSISRSFSQLDGVTGGLIGQVSQLGGALTGAFAGATAGANKFGLALKATGIGILLAIAGAVVSITRSVDRSVDGFYKAREASLRWQLAIAPIKDIFTDIATGVLDFVGNLVNRDIPLIVAGFKAIGSDLLNFFNSNIDKVKTYAEIGSNYIKAVFKKGYSFEDARREQNELNEALLQKEQEYLDKRTDIYDDYNKSVDNIKTRENSAKRIADLERQIFETELQQRKLIAKADLEVRKLKEQVYQEDKYTTEQRIEFLKEAQAIEQGALQKDIDLIQNKIKLQKELNNIGYTDKEGEMALANLQADLEQKRVDSANVRLELEAQIQGIYRQNKATIEGILNSYNGFSGVVETYDELEAKLLNQLQLLGATDTQIKEFENNFEKMVQSESEGLDMIVNKHKYTQDQITQIELDAQREREINDAIAKANQIGRSEQFIRDLEASMRATYAEQDAITQYEKQQREYADLQSRYENNAFFEGYITVLQLNEQQKRLEQEREFNLLKAQERGASAEEVARIEREYEQITFDFKAQKWQSELGILQSFFNQKSRAYKAFAKAQAAVDIAVTIADSFKAHNEILASPSTIPEPGGSIQKQISAKLALISGLASAAKMAQSLSKIGGSGSTGSVASGVSSASQQIQQPQFNIISPNQTNEIAQSVQQSQQKPIKAYVVSTEVTTSQELENKAVLSSSL